MTALRTLLAPILVLLWAGTALGQTFQLTEAEEAWLAAHPVIRLGPAPGFPPVEFYDEAGTARGLAADYVALVAARLGVRFEPVRCASWDEVLARTRAGEIDAWAEAAATPEREAANMLDVATRNAERLISLVDDILDVARLERGEVEFQIASHLLGPLLDAAVEINQPYAARLEVRLERGECPEDVSVAVDAERFAQLMSNLISNASKFSTAGEAVDVFAALADGSNGERVRVAVRDRGPGIPSEFRSRIFQRFAQADPALTRATAGTGLGLAICRTIVERLGGEIGYDTAEGEGTTFWFDLPAERPVASPVGE